ncbi:hypothetical protein QE152_g19394 [Popillia japonica]|uniref:Uncharacterized protein n=1 Tax=Popillia japonica TaxID=7064 RepID=A0AAW1KT13_POPJA
MTRLKLIVLSLCAVQIAATPLIEYDTTTSESNISETTTELSRDTTNNRTDIETTTELINAIQEDIAANLVKTDIESRFNKDGGEDSEGVTQYSRASILQDNEEICDDQFSTSQKPTTYHPRFGGAQSTMSPIFNPDVTATTEGTETITTTTEINFVPTEENEVSTPPPSTTTSKSDQNFPESTDTTSFNYGDRIRGDIFSRNQANFGLATPPATTSNSGETSPESTETTNFNYGDRIRGDIFSRNQANFGWVTAPPTTNPRENSPDATDQIIGSDFISSTSVKYGNQASFGLVTSTTPSNAGVWRYQTFSVPKPNKNDKVVFSRFGFGTKFNGFSSNFIQPESLVEDVVSSTNSPPKTYFLDNNPDLARFSITPSTRAPPPNENLFNFGIKPKLLPIDFGTTSIRSEIPSTTTDIPDLISPKLSTTTIAPIDFGTTSIRSEIPSTTTSIPDLIIPKLSTTTISPIDFGTTSIRSKIPSTTTSIPDLIIPKLSTTTISPIDFGTTSIRSEIPSTTTDIPDLISPKLSTTTIAPIDFGTTSIRSEIPSTTTSIPDLIIPKLSTTTISPIDFGTTSIRSEIPSPTTDIPDLITPIQSTYANNLVTTLSPAIPTEFSSTTPPSLSNFNFAPSSSYTNHLTSFDLNANKKYDLFNGIRTLPPAQITTTTPPPIRPKFFVTPKMSIPHPSIELFSKIGDRESKLPPMNRGKINVPSEILPPKFGGRSDTTTEGLVKALFSGEISFGNGTNPESKTGSFYNLQSIQSYNLAFINSAPTNRFQPIKPHARTPIFRAAPHKPELFRPTSARPQFSLDLIDKYTSANFKIDTVNLGKTGSINRVGDSRRPTFFNGLNIYNPSVATFLK